MATVTIESEEYTTYASVAEADTYLNADLSAEAWREADTNTKGRGLVGSTRWIDEQKWIEAYDTVAERQASTTFVNASIELAARLVEDPAYRTSFAAADFKRLKAGSVEIENWRGQTVQVTSVFPADIMALLGEYLAGSAASTAGVLSFGTCRKDTLSRGFGFREGI